MGLNKLETDKATNFSALHKYFLIGFYTYLTFKIKLKHKKEDKAYA